MARAGGINDLVYYGAIGGGLFLGYRLALDGDLGCDAWLAAAEVYRSLNRGASPPAPRPGTPASKDNCVSRLGAPAAPAAAAPPAPAAPAPAPRPPAAAAPAAAPSGPAAAWSAYQWHDDGLCWFDIGYSDGHVDSWPSGIDANCGPRPVSLRRPTSLTDSGGFPVVWDSSAGALRQDPDQGGTNIYGPGAFFIDTNGKQWTWIGPEAVLVAWDGSDQQLISSFFA